MKKLSVFVALVLLAVAGTGYAVTCAYDNVPGATLLVPYWRVSLNGATGAPIPTGGVDTLVSMVNVSTPGIIAHVTVWNKYSAAVLDFNVPLTGKDVVSFSMRDIMNGKLNVNATQFISATHIDPCGVNLTNGTYKPSVGFGATQFIRFSHPEAGSPNSDAFTSVSVYATDAFAAFRSRVWDSLDESGDITSFSSSGGNNILDFDNPACGVGGTNGDGTYKSDLSGYLTIDVVNYCTNYFPSQDNFYSEDAIATTGWSEPYECNPEYQTCTQSYTPNVLMGDIFYIDTASQGGNISGDQAIAIEFDPTLNVSDFPGTKTFFGKYVWLKTSCLAETTSDAGCQLYPGVPVDFRFGGDGRESLGEHYGFRYLSDQANGLQTWMLAWRSDSYNDTVISSGAPTGTPTVDLCDWLAAGGPPGSGLFDSDHQLVAAVYDNDENSFTGSGGPSGGSAPSNTYVFLETQRINLLNNGQINPGGFKGGWIDATFHGNGPGYAYNNIPGSDWNQAWVGVQHTAPGAFLSVGHSATELNNYYNCINDALYGLSAIKTRASARAPRAHALAK
jgi:hypothetical protein